MTNKIIGRDNPQNKALEEINFKTAWELGVLAEITKKYELSSLKTNKNKQFPTSKFLQKLIGLRKKFQNFRFPMNPKS